MKTFLTAVGMLGLVLGQVYLCEFTSIKPILLYFTPVVISAIGGIVANGGIPKTGGKIVVNGDGQNSGKWYSLPVSVFAILLVIVEVFTVLALNER